MVTRLRRLLLALSLGLAPAACGGGEPPSSAAPAPVITPDRFTETVADDADDPAIWVHPTDPSRSLIVGTNKAAAPAGALVVFGLDGRIRQTIAGLDRPNNVDVESAVMIDGVTTDLVVTTERLQHRLRVYRISEGDQPLQELGVMPVLEGERAERSEPMGIGLYKRPADGALFAIVAPKYGGRTDYLWQYRLEGDGRGGVRGTLVRRFGAFSDVAAEPGELGEIEAIVVDDALGYVYYADERYGIHKWHADPDHADAGRELAVLGLSGYQGDREGLALFARPDGTGYLVSTDQIPGGSVYKLYRREGESGRPHVHELVAEARTTVDETDGLDVTLTPLPGFPSGLAVAMHSRERNFALFDWARLFPGVR